jgi:hypothetical protein
MEVNAASRQGVDALFLVSVSRMLERCLKWQLMCSMQPRRRHKWCASSAAFMLSLVLMFECMMTVVAQIAAQCTAVCVGAQVWV